MGPDNFDTSNVKSTFNSNKVVKDYTRDARKIGLWNSERIIVEKYFDKEDYILDIGCGAGRTTLNLYELGYRNILGLDLSERMIEEATNLSKDINYNIEFQVGDVMNLQFSNCKFDAAMFSYNGIMHIPRQKNRVKALKEIKRVLKTNSYFFFTAHDRCGIKGEYSDVWKEEKRKWKNKKEDKRLYEFGDMIINIGDKPTYFHFPTRQEVIDTIQKAGFKIVEDLPRSEICTEPKKIEKEIADCRFYIVKKT